MYAHKAMWRRHFYEKSIFGRYVYQPIVGGILLLTLFGTIYQYACRGASRPFAFVIVLAGFGLFVAAKISVIETGKWFSFGASAAERMSKPMAWCYYGGYILMILGFILTF